MVLLVISLAVICLVTMKGFDVGLVQYNAKDAFIEFRARPQLILDEADLGAPPFHNEHI
jgi:hypothetical protein